MYYIEVSRLRNLWKCCGLVSVHQTTVIRSLHCLCIYRYSLTDCWQTVGPPCVPVVVNFTSDHTYVKKKKVPNSTVSESGVRVTGFEAVKMFRLILKYSDTSANE